MKPPSLSSPEFAPLAVPRFSPPDTLRLPFVSVMPEADVKTLDEFHKANELAVPVPVMNVLGLLVMWFQSTAFAVRADVALIAVFALRAEVALSALFACSAFNAKGTEATCVRGDTSRPAFTRTPIHRFPSNVPAANGVTEPSAAE